MGAIGLVKLGKGALSLSASSYTAIKAFRIKNNAKRIAFIKANYAKIGKYISARRSLLRTGNRIKQIFRRSIDPREALKLQMDLNRRQIAALRKNSENAYKKTALAARPSKRQTAKAQLALAKYETAKEQASFLRKARMFGKSYNNKAAAYNRQAEMFNRGLAPAPQLPNFRAGELEFAKAYDNYKNSLYALEKAKKNYKSLSLYNTYISAPIKKWVKESGAAKADLGLWRLESGKTITLSKALGIKNLKTANPISHIFTRTQKSAADKFYSFLDKKHLSFLSKAVKFVNSKAALTATALIFNYNVAAATPSALASTGKIIPVASELLVKAWKTAPAFSWEAIRAATPQLKPADLVDPKIFRRYNTIPLPAGNVINSFRLKPALGTTNKLLSSSRRSLLESSRDPKNILPPAYINIPKDIMPLNALKPVSPGISPFFPLFAAPQTAQASDFLLSPKPIPYDSPIPNREGTFLSYEEKVTPIINSQIDCALGALFQVNDVMLDAEQIIKFIKDKKLSSNKALSIKTFNKNIDKLKAIAPYLTIPTFQHLLKIAVNGDALAKIANTNISSKSREKRIASYINSMKYLDAYQKALSSPGLRFSHVAQFSSVKNFTKKRIEQSVHSLSEVEFAETNLSSLFESQALKHSIKKLIRQKDAKYAMDIAAALIKTKNQIEQIKRESPPGQFTDIKGCLINNGDDWDKNSEITPDRIAISAETPAQDIKEAIVNWIHETNTPQADIKVKTPDFILSKLNDWASYMLGVSPENPAHYIENRKGETLVYNHDYTVRMRLGSHEIINDSPHIHFEYLKDNKWHGLLNNSYTFKKTGIDKNEIIQALYNLQKHFKPIKLNKAQAVLDYGAPPARKTLYIIGGPNGSGKTNLYGRLFSDKNLPFLNQDIIAAQNNLNAMAAGRVLINLKESMIKNGTSFIMESTLSGKSVAPILKQAKKEGYKVVIIYTFVKSADESIARVKARVAQGGHDAPYGNLAERYYKSRNNFWNTYKDMADDWIMFFNGDKEILPIAYKYEGKPIYILNKKLFNIYQPQGQIKPLPAEAAPLSD